MLFWCVLSQFQLGTLLLWIVVRKLQHSVCLSTTLVWKQAAVRHLYPSPCSYATDCCRHDCLYSWCVSICLQDSLIVTPSVCLFAFHLFSISISFCPLILSVSPAAFCSGFKSRQHSFSKLNRLLYSSLNYLLHSPTFYSKPVGLSFLFGTKNKML